MSIYRNGIFKVIIKCFSLIVILIPALPVTGQQSYSAPVITIVSPSSSDSLNNTGITLFRAEIVSYTALKSFRIYDNEMVIGNETGIKVLQKDNITYIIESLIPLRRGSNSLYLDAKNSIGSANSEKRIIYSQNEPFITWLTPASVNSTSKSGILTIKTEIKTDYDLKNVNINLNGNKIASEQGDITPQNNGIYILEKALSLKTGKNSVSITAGNVRGITVSSTRFVVFSDPVITLLNPSPNDSLNNTGVTLVKAEIISRTALKGFRLFINDVIIGSETGITATKKDSVTYIVESLVPLKGGQNIIYLDARNSIGSASSEKRTINSQREPFIIWLTPSSFNSTLESGMLNIKAEIKTNSDLKNVRINLNGNEFVVEKERITNLNSDTYILEKSLQLKTGKNSIYITASNARGITSSTVRVVNYSSGSIPVITLLSPTSRDSLNNKGIILFRAEITSHTALKTYRVFDNMSIVGSEKEIKVIHKDSITYILESLIPLYKGQNIIYLEASNSTGSANSEKVNITSQLEPFIKWLIPGSSNSFTVSGMLTVKAEIKTDNDLKNVSINLNGTELMAEKGEITRLNDNTYSFEKTIRLNSDKNSIYISAGNSSGTTRSTVNIVNFLNVTAPVITLVSPNKEDSINNSGIILVSAEIVSNAELQSVRIFHNRISDIASKLEHRDSNTYILKSLIPLQAGSNVVFVDAKNFIGTTSSEKRVIVCQLEPIIKWILPSSLSTTAEMGNLNIKAEIKTSLDLLGASVNINGSSSALEKEAINRLNNDTYILESTVPLRTGINTIGLNAVNAKGTGHSDKRSVNFVPGIVSEIKWIDPSDINYETYQPEIQLSASIKTMLEIKSTNLSVNGTSLAPEGRAKISVKNANEYLYKSRLTLKPGVNTIDLSVITDTRTIISEKRVINYLVPTLPTLTWRDPVSERSVVNNPGSKICVSIKSYAKPGSITVYVNGKALGDSNLINKVKKENEAFVLEDTLSLREGDNTIFVVADNQAGSARSEIRTINYTNLTKPVITWKNPETPASTITVSTISLKAAINSSTDLLNLQLYQNEKAISAEFEIDTANRKQGEYKLEKTLILEQGENKIYIVAENSDGRSVSETRSINYLTPAEPQIIWLSPSVPHTDYDSYFAEVRLAIKLVDRLQSVLAYVNGSGSEDVDHLSPQNEPGEYILKKVINLRPGENNVYLVVTNSVGTTKSETRYFTYSPANPPVITWTIPTYDSIIVNTDLVAVEVCIKSATGLKSAQILVNGVQQASDMIFQAPQTGDCNFSFSKSVVLKEGDNSIFIIAENSAGTNRSDKRLIKFQKSLAEKRLALVIGNSEYNNSMVLKNPVNDANLMEGTLKSLGFNVVKLLNATKNDMMSAIREFSAKLPENNVALFYYAGHGIQVNGQNFLIPTDAILNVPDDCKWEAVSQTTVVEEFEKVPDNINIVILDACRNNPFKSWDRGGVQSFRVMNAVTGTIIAYATSENSGAADGLGFNGVFTEELVRQMNISQPISSVFMNTRKQVMKRTNNLQRPAESNMLTGEFYFKK